MRPRMGERDSVSLAAIANNLAEIGTQLEKLVEFVEDLWILTPPGRAAVEADEAKNDPHGGF